MAFILSTVGLPVGFRDSGERARCTARTFPFLGFFCSLHSRYISITLNAIIVV